MKHLLLTTIAAVVLMGCATTQSPEPPTAEASDISIHDVARDGNIEAVKQHLAAGTDINAKGMLGAFDQSGLEVSRTLPPGRRFRTTCNAHQQSDSRRVGEEIEGL